MSEDISVLATHNQAAHLINVYLRGQKIEGKDIVQICALIKAAYVSHKAEFSDERT